MKLERKESQIVEGFVDLWEKVWKALEGFTQVSVLIWLPF